MFSLSHLLIGLTMMVLGVVLVKWSFQISNITGSQEWIERFVGAGMTNGVYKIFGVLLVITGVLFATGFGGSLMNFLFSPLRHFFNPTNNPST
jgi:hypothetical protein